MIEYVCGFLFGDRGRVALIHKAKPDWQKGRVNGIGGHIEPGESPKDAMQREFREETGYFTFDYDWHHRVTLQGQDWKVYFFYAKRDQTVDLKYDGEEPCEWFDYLSLPYNVLPNLRWLIPLCLDTDLVFPITIADHTEPGKSTGGVFWNIQALRRIDLGGG